MKIFTFLILLIPCICFSQKTTVDRPEKLVEPNPYETAYLNNKDNYTNIKNVMTIVKDKSNDFEPDTIRMVDYDMRGNKKKDIKYKNSSVSETSNYEYYSNGDLRSWEKIGNKSSLITYSYDGRKRIIITKEFKIQSTGSDPVLVSTKEFKYESSNLTDIITNETRREKYHYQNEKLRTKIKGYSIGKFNYDEEENLIGINQYLGKKVASDKMMFAKSFSYNEENLLVVDSILTSSNMKNKDYQITRYEYDGDLLKKMKAKFKTYYRNVEFEYEDDRIKEIHINTNQSKNDLKHWISYNIKNYYTFPISSKEIFEYDEHGNITSKKVYVNNELFSDTQYLIKY